MSKLEPFQRQMEALHQAYVKQLPQKVRQIDDLWRAVCGGAWGDTESLELLHYLIHKLNGSGSTFGFTAITKGAERLDQVVKRLMEQGRGLTLDDKVQGDQAMASLYLSVQAAASDLTDSAVVETHREEREAPPEQPAQAVAHGSIVLVADDEAFLRKRLVLILREAGFYVEEAEDGAAALMQARIQRPDVILMDYVMPGMDGVEVVAQLRQDPALSDVPVLLMTTHQKVQDVRRAVECDVQGFVAKPFDGMQVIDQVNACLANAANPPSEAVPEAPKKHILIADDFILYRKKIALTLQQAGYDVREADNGVMALKQARERTPDLILMDVMMPVMDGIEATQQMRLEESLRDVPIIVLTTNVKMKDVPIALASGADAYISKPQSALKLVEKVKSCLAAV